MGAWTFDGQAIHWQNDQGFPVAFAQSKGALWTLYMIRVDQRNRKEWPQILEHPIGNCWTESWTDVSHGVTTNGISAWKRFDEEWLVLVSGVAQDDLRDWLLSEVGSF